MHAPLIGGLTRGYALVLLAVALQRLAELAWSRRNLRRLADPRPSERTRDWALMVAAHVLLIALPALEAALRPRPAPRAVFYASLAAFLAAQLVRVWTLAALGPAWNARAVVDPGLGVVARGPYRWVRHPNYLAVLVEFVAVPAAGGAWIALVLLNLLHAPVLARRVRAEEAQLERVPGYRAAMAGKGRFLPRLLR